MNFKQNRIWVAGQMVNSEISVRMLTLHEDDIFITQSHMLARLYDTLVTPEFFSSVKQGKFT